MVTCYNPTTGLFTSLDPVEGGNPNDYTYPTDPINKVDLDGRQLDYRLGSNRGHGTARWSYQTRSDSTRGTYKPSRGSYSSGGLSRRSGRSRRDRNERYSSCRHNSFTPETQIVMADGTQKPIVQVEIGDLVLATDMDTGHTGPYPVTDIILGDGMKRLVQISVDSNGDGALETATATSDYPIYDLNARSFVAAASLALGSNLSNPDGRSIGVQAVRRVVRAQRVYNLTVQTAHTYYVGVGGSSFLTHNCNRKITGFSGHARERMQKFHLDADDIRQIFTRGRHAGPGTTRGSVLHQRGNYWVVVGRDGTMISVGKVKWKNRRRK